MLGDIGINLSKTEQAKETHVTVLLVMYIYPYIVIRVVSGIYSI